MKLSTDLIRNQYRGVIFDLDGTLIDSMWMWRDIDIEYLGRFGHALPDDYQKTIEGHSFHEVAVYTKERFGIPDDPEEIKAEWNRMAFEYYRTKVGLKPEAARFLAFLNENRIPIGIATSNSRLLLETVLDSLQIKDCFTVMKTACEVVRGKPFPDIFLSVAEDMNIEPSDCLVFEDVEAGIEAAKAAGMATCAVYDAFNEEFQDAIREKSDFYLKEYKELFDENS